MKSQITRRTALAGAAATIALPTRAQAYPERPVRMIIPFAPAGGTDIAARLLGEQLSAILGQQVIADNRPGANGIIAGEALRAAPADGHTILVATAASFGAAPALGQKLPYDVERDFTPVAMLGLFPLVLNAAPGLAAKDLAGFLDLAKKSPGALNYASAGVGGTNHLVFELIAQAAGIKLTHVPYRGAALAATDVMSGQVQVMVDSLAASLQNIEGGKIRALGVTSASRQPQLPNVPTLKEQGVDVVYPGWASFVVASGTPPAAVNALNAAVNRALQAEILQKRYRDLVIEAAAWSPAETARFMAADRATLTELVRRTGIKVE